MTLEALIADLSGELCTPVDETQPLDASTRIRVRAFVVLSHAEFENYIEQLCRDRATEIRTAAEAGSCLPALLSLALKYADDLKGQHVSGTDLIKTAQTAVGLYGGIVKANHGIKRANLESLLGPVGISPNDLSVAAEDFVLATENLAALRGPAAHVGDSGFTQDHYPSNASSAITAVMNTLHQFVDLLKF